MLGKDAPEEGSRCLRARQAETRVIPLRHHQADACSGTRKAGVNCTEAPDENGMTSRMTAQRIQLLFHGATRISYLSVNLEAEESVRSS